jgi:hypothetical protein
MLFELDPWPALNAATATEFDAFEYWVCRARLKHETDEVAVKQTSARSRANSASPWPLSSRRNLFQNPVTNISPSPIAVCEHPLLALVGLRVALAGLQCITQGNSTLRRGMGQWYGGISNPFHKSYLIAQQHWTIVVSSPCIYRL